MKKPIRFESNISPDDLLAKLRSHIESNGGEIYSDESGMRIWEIRCTEDNVTTWIAYVVQDDSN